MRSGFFQRLFAGFCFFVPLAAAPADLPPPANRPIQFQKDVEPIFAKHCYACHGPEKQKGDLRLDVKPIALKGGSSGPAIVPGKSGESRLIQLVASTDSDSVMPQKGERLSKDQIGLLRAWIDQGANWPDGLEASDYQTRANHWAFKPVLRPAVPKVKPSARPLNAIDNFILARLEKENFLPSPEAGRVTLIRRLHFDLIGLPPTPEEVAAFLADRKPDAYERLAKRLLDSPQFGERWARHWLDVVRFAESHGFEMNQPRPNAWPYREYVIRAFNEDRPYDRFIREQLAGDVLGEEVATGFLVGGPWGPGEKSRSGPDRSTARG